jgi:hypothetical protein
MSSSKRADLPDSRRKNHDLAGKNTPALRAAQLLIGFAAAGRSRSRVCCPTRRDGAVHRRRKD